MVTLEMIKDAKEVLKKSGTLYAGHISTKNW